MINSTDLPARPLRVLIADDNRDAADTLAKLVRYWGHETATRYDGRTALDAALASPPDVAILDLAMPGLNGLVLAARLLAAIPPNRILLIAVTAFAGDQLRRPAMEAGFDQFHTKPCDPQQLRTVLAERQAALAQTTSATV